MPKKPAAAKTPDHPVLKPATPFSVGEEVVATIKGQTVTGKVTAVEGDKYRISFGATATVTVDQLRKAG